jgi:hypothetical protein
VDNGECIIGMQRPAMIPLIVFDLLVNVGGMAPCISHLALMLTRQVYLTIIFLRPLSG